MSFEGFGVAIMAAGKGTRLKSKRPKVLHEVGGRALLLHVIAAAGSISPPDQIFCIIGHAAERVRSAVASTGVLFVIQSAGPATRSRSSKPTFSPPAPLLPSICSYSPATFP